MFNKKLKNENKALTAEVARLTDLNKKYATLLRDQDEDLIAIYSMFPLYVGQEVFEIQLRSKSGRFTKTKPSREHSTIVCVTVDKKNYFNLVDKLKNGSVFNNELEAQKYLESVCVE